MQKLPKNKFKILAIETSCDETSIAVLEVICYPERAKRVEGSSQKHSLDSSPSVQNDNKNLININILSNIISSQVKIHAQYGGVYPELASREHVKNIIPVLKQALYFSNPKSQVLNPKQIPNSNFQKNLKSEILNLKSEINYIAVTTGPGLIGSLLVGVETAKTLSYVFNKPIIPVNHLEGHIYANFVNEICVNSKLKTQNSKINLKSKIPQFPLLALVVSGGHTSLIYMKNHLNYKIIGETLDDAAGEAYDKVASMLGLTYPGGPAIDTIASKLSVIARSPSGTTKQSNTRSPRPIRTRDDKGNIKVSQLQRFQQAKRLNKLNELFPRPMLNKNNFDFSFSGLKTSVLYYLKKQPKPFTQILIQRTCYEFQEAVTDVLVAKTLRAAQKYHVKSILVCGGVAANNRLHQKFANRISQIANRKNNKLYAISHKPKFFIPEKFLCTDNAAMIGAAAAYKIIYQNSTCPSEALAKGDKILYNKDIVDWKNISANANLKLK